VLVPLDGDPKLLPVPKSPLLRVANTPFLMLYEPAAKTYYLKGGADWLAATDLKGPWQDVKKLPEAITALEAEAKKAAPGKASTKEVEATAGKMPEVIVTTTPAELLATDGEPQYTPIKATNLLFVSNTESNIFMDTATQEYLVLISGRWFKTKSLAAGPWTYVAPNQLPADFAKIPENSAKGFVLVNVAGTSQAKEAVLDNSIPQTATIDRKKATTKVAYAGEPKFAKIPETDLEYAENTGTTVFKEGTRYYAVDQGVWYEADSPNGPWKVSATPPQQVDKIPPDNPRYNAKYVKVYEATDDTVTVGYTPGYTGSYVDNGTVVYGTGYDYAGYAAPEVYIPPPAPVTYGYAAAYDPYAGSWGCQPAYYNPASWLVPGLVGFAAGMAVGYAAWGHGPYYWGGGGWWGPHGYNNININNIHNNIINPRPGPGPHPPHWRPDGRPIIHPVVSPQNRSNIYNRPGNQGNLAARTQRPETRPASQVKPATQPARPGQAVKPGTQPGKPGPAAGTRPAATQPKVRPAGGQNNVLADKNGHVYKRDNAGNWQQRQGNQWSGAGAAKPAARPATSPRPTPPTDITRRPQPGTMHPPTATRPSYDSGQLNRDYQARQRGETRTQNFQRSQGASYSRPSPSPSASFSRPSGGGGGGAGFHGAGGGRRR